MKIRNDKAIEINRGDSLSIKLTNKSGNFNVNDKIKFTILEKGNYNKIVLQKEYTISEESNEFYITLSSNEMKIGEIISKPITYWYEIEYNGEQTLIGYDENGAKKFILYPEAPNGDDE